MEKLLTGCVSRDALAAAGLSVLLGPAVIAEDTWDDIWDDIDDGIGDDIGDAGRDIRGALPTSCTSNRGLPHMPQNRFIGSASRPHFEQILGMIIHLGVI